MSQTNVMGSWSLGKNDMEKNEFLLPLLSNRCSDFDNNLQEASTLRSIRSVSFSCGSVIKNDTIASDLLRYYFFFGLLIVLTVMLKLAGQPVLNFIRTGIKYEILLHILLFWLAFFVKLLILTSLFKKISACLYSGAVRFVCVTCYKTL